MPKDLFLFAVFAQELLMSPLSLYATLILITMHRYTLHAYFSAFSDVSFT